MKSFTKQNILIGVTFFLITASIIAGILLCPDSVTYTAVQNTQKIPEHKDISCQYDRVFDIREKGPFYIEDMKGKLYVCYDGKYLYRINIPSDHLSGSDKSSLLSGIEIADRMTLFEIVEYIES